MTLLPIRRHSARRCVEALIFFACAFYVCMYCAPRSSAQMGLSALPTMLRVPLLERHDRVRLVPSASYGFTESVLSTNDSHHRASVGAGVAASTESGFAGELRMDARYDKHLGDEKDDGGVIDARTLARYTRALNPKVALGAQLGLWVPGENAPKPAFAASTVDALAIVGLTPSERISFTFNAGYRLDQSAKSVSAPERLSEADWVGLGLSDFDALLLGLGLQHSLDSFRWFGELTGDLLVGSGAPTLTRSPLRVALGASTELGSPATRGSLIAQALLSKRVPVDVNAALVPFEPRFTMMFAVSQDFDWGQEQAVAEPTPTKAPEPERVAEPAPAPAPAPPVLPLGVLRVLVRDTDRGEAVAARVRVTTAAGEAVTAEQKPGPRGGIEVELTPGSYEVEISADGFASQRRRLSIDEHGVTVINIDLRPKEGR